MVGRPAPPLPAPDLRPVLNLTLDDAIKRALANNVDIAMEKLNPERSELDVAELKGFYQPFLTSSLRQDSSTLASTSILAGAEVENRDQYVYDFGAHQALPTGGNLRLDFLNNRRKSNSFIDTFNPSFNSILNAQLAQPLLRDFRVDGRRYQIKVAKKNREISDVQFRQTVVNQVAEVKNRYQHLRYSIDNLEVQRKSLDLAAKLVAQNRLKERAGTLAPLEVVAAESEQASREESVILAEAAVAEAEDFVRRVIYPDNEPTTWTHRIVPTDRVEAKLVSVDAAAALSKALQNRTDLVAARKRLESSEYAINYARNQLLPALDVVAAYGTTGIGGTFLRRDISQGFGGPVIETIPGGYGDALSDLFRNDFPTWTVGVNLSYPILNRQADAAHARAKVTRDQGKVGLQRLEMQITAEVRTAVRAVETNYKRVETTQAAVMLQERRLDAETKKFAAGMSTSYFVTQAQRDLSLAEVAELRAVLQYGRSLIDFERVQETALGSVVALVAAPPPAP